MGSIWLSAADDIAHAFEERTRPHRCSPQLAITNDGLVLGPAVVLAQMEKDQRGRPRLVLDEKRAAALLATAFEQPIGPRFLAALRRAVDLWNEDDRARAQLQLTFAGLPPCGDPGLVLRLFVAEALLDAGACPDTLLRAQGFEPGPLDVDGALTKGGYNPDQPRDDHGRWTGDGAAPAAFRGKGRLRALGEFLDWLKSPRRSEPAGEIKPHREIVEPKPNQSVEKPPHAEAGPASQAPVHEQDYPLSRPGKGKPVNIPGLPTNIKGVDNTKRRASAADYKTNLTRSEFEAKLNERGWRSEPSKDGEAMNYFSPNGAKYSVRDNSKSHDGPSADYYHTDGNGKDIDMKLRLRKE